jgi:hypothetical protein
MNLFEKMIEIKPLLSVQYIEIQHIKLKINEKKLTLREVLIAIPEEYITLDSQDTLVDGHILYLHSILKGVNKLPYKRVSALERIDLNLY